MLISKCCKALGTKRYSPSKYIVPVLETAGALTHCTFSDLFLNM